MDRKTALSKKATACIQGPLTWKDVKTVFETADKMISEVVRTQQAPIKKYPTEKAYYTEVISRYNKLKEGNKAMMDRKQALQILIDHNNWRRYDGPITDSPQMPDPKIVGEAIDVAIHELELLCQKKPDREYYGK